MLIAKLGLDGHERGALVLVNALRTAGFKVFYSGIRCTAFQIAQMVIENNIDVIGFSSHVGNHMQMYCDLLQALRGMDVKIVGGGIIPPEDVQTLLRSGVSAVFTPGTSMNEIIEKIKIL